MSKEHRKNDSMYGKRWTDEEVSILREKYPDQGTDIPELDRTKGAIKEKARRLGLSCRLNRRPWTKEEVEILKDKYPEQGADIPELDRTRSAIWHKARRLGINNRIEHIELTESLREYLDGLLLGDGSLPEGRGNPWYAHTDSSKEYLLWLKSKLEQLGLPCHDVCSNKKAFLMSSAPTPGLKKLRKRWYPQGNKKIPCDLEITPTILKNWYIGDGSRYKSRSSFRIEICCCFDPEGKQRMVDQINERTDIEAHNNQRSIHILKEAHQAFFEYTLSDNHEIPPGYKYKFPKEYVRDFLD